nr:mucin-5AC [Aedes albopictus]
MDVTECCRLCLKDASSAEAARIDLHQDQTVADMVQEVYDIYIKDSHRGSSYICVPCYRNVAKVKTHLDRHKTTRTLAAMNQSIMEAQDDAFMEESDDEDFFTSSKLGYRRPTSSPVDVLLSLKDCMQSKRFREALTERSELGHLLVSGPIYQRATGSFLDTWHPTQLYCHKCRSKFDSKSSLEEHTISCKFKCIFCSRSYTHEESLNLHSCPRRDKHKKAKKRKAKLHRLNNATKTSKTTTPSPTEKSQPAIVADSVVQQKEQPTTVVPIPQLLPAPVAAPRIEGEANLDAELTNLLERWYGQGEDIEELSHLSVGAIDAPLDNGVFTNSDLYSRIIDSSYQATTAAPKPAISVRPMSQLIETPVEQSLPSSVPALVPLSDTNVPMDVIEIDDDDDVHTTLPVAPSASASTAGKPEQTLSEKDILNIVKHFRGIDENESYLVKAKINGAQKLICISKRKNESGVQTSVAAPVSQNSNSALQAGSRNPPQKQIVIAPSVKQSSVQNANTIIPSTAVKPPLAIKSVASINGAPSASTGPQLKISHVQSLVSDPSTSQQPAPRLLNGMPQQTTTVALKPNLAVRKAPAASFTVRTAQPKPSAANKPAPQRIIVGSNSLKFVSNSGGAPNRFVPIAPKPDAGPSPPRAVFVQRKQVQTIIQSSTSTVTRTNIGGNVESTTTSSSSSTTTDFNNSLLKTQLLQQPAKVYPGGSGTAPNGNRNIASKSTTLGGALASLAGSNRQFKLNNTTIKRMN